MMRSAVVLAVAFCAAIAAAQDAVLAAVAPVEPVYNPAAAASQSQQLLLAQQLLTQLQTVGDAQKQGFAAVTEEVRRAAAASTAAAAASASGVGDDAGDAKVLAAVEQTQQSVSKAAGQLNEAVAAVDSAQRQLIGEFATQKQALKSVSEGVAGATASLTSIVAKQADDAKANTQLAEQLKRIAAAIDAVSEGVKKPAASAGPTKEEAAANAAARKADGERLDSLHSLQRDTNAKLEAIEAAIARLTNAVETAHRESVEGRSFTVRIKNFALEAKHCALQCWGVASEFVTTRLHTLRPLIADWIATLHLQNRAIAAWEHAQQSAQYWGARAVEEGRARAEQLSEFIIRNGFPAAHAPIMALTLVLTSALIVGVLALWILSKTLIPILRKALSAFAWTVGLIALAIRGVLCCRLCRRSRAAGAGAGSADAAASKKAKKSKKPKKSPTASGSAAGAADDEEPPSEDEVIPPTNTRK